MTESMHWFTPCNFSINKFFSIFVSLFAMQSGSFAFANGENAAAAMTGLRSAGEEGEITLAPLALPVDWVINLTDMISFDESMRGKTVRVPLNVDNVSIDPGIWVRKLSLSECADDLARRDIILEIAIFQNGFTWNNAGRSWPWLWGIEKTYVALSVWASSVFNGTETIRLTKNLTANPGLYYVNDNEEEMFDLPRNVAGASTGDTIKIGGNEIYMTTSKVFKEGDGNARLIKRDSNGTTMESFEEFTLWGSNAYITLNRPSGNGVQVYSINAVADGAITGSELKKHYIERWSIEDPEILAQSIDIVAPQTTVPVGETITWTATILPEDATNKEVNWSTTTGTIIQLDPKPDGSVVILWLVPGDFAVTAKTANGKEDTKEGTVTEAPDTEAPTVVHVSYSTTAPTNQDVTVRLTFSETIQALAGFTAISDTEYSKTYSENTTETLHFYDLAGNAGSYEITISNIDKIAPVITLLGDNPATLTVGDTYTDAGATATDNRDGDITHKIETTGSVDTGAAGTYTITYSVSDEAGNTASAARTVVVNTAPDTEAPTVVHISYSTTAPTNRDVTVRLTFSETIQALAGFTAISDTVYSKTYSENTTETLHFYDLAGNAGSYEISISNIDKIAPVITLLGDNPATLTVGDTYTDAGATATDNRDGDITHKIETTGSVDTGTAGTYTITYSVSDEAGNTASAARMVVVNTAPDTEAPTVVHVSYSTTAPTNQDVTVTLTFSETIQALAGFTAISDTEYSKTYSENTTETLHFYDLAGNAGSYEITISNIDKIAPVITLLGDNPATLTVGDTYTDDGATATDNRDGDITHKIETTGSVDTGTAGTYTITYSVSDEAGNTASATRMVEVNLPNSIDAINATDLRIYYDGEAVVCSPPCETMRVYTLSGLPVQPRRLAPGVYIVWVMESDGACHVRKIIIE